MNASIRDSKATEIVCSYTCGATFEALPANVVDCTKRVILDTLGCMVLGSTIDSAQVMREFVASVGGAPQATVIGGDLKTFAGYAALANGTAGHADEMDSSHISWGHPGGIAIATSLAICESKNLGGKDFIVGVALMHDIGARMMAAAGGRRAVMDTHHSHSSALYAVGAGAAAGRLLGLPPSQMRHALALASMNISSPAAFFDESNHMTKAMTHGQSAYAGVTGALLALNGLEGNERILESRNGIMDLWWTDKADVGEITARLGDYYSITDTGFKYYSAGYPIHAPLYGALTLMRENAIRPEKISKVRVGMSTQSADIVDSRETASISLQAMLGLGMFLGKLGYEDAHDEAALEGPEVKRLRSMIEIFRDPDMDRRAPTTRAAWVEITTTNGKVVMAPEQLPPGHWERGGAPWNELEEKFSALVVPRLGEPSCRELVQLVKGLEKLPDLQRLARLLSPRAKS